MLVVPSLLVLTAGVTRAQEGQPKAEETDLVAEAAITEEPAELAASFDGDGYDDLAVGVPDEDVGTTLDAGAVNVIYGTSSGLLASDDQIWDQDNGGLVDLSEESDGFGMSLAVGDFDSDGYADLAVGVPYEAVGAVTYAGAVHILYGTFAGLTSIGDQLWHQDSPDIEGTAEDNDFFGSSLAIGDFNHDGYDDLAIGAPGEAVDTLVYAGAVHVIYGSSSGLSAAGNQVWLQDSVGILDIAEAQDRFGNSLAAADFDGDGYDDLAIGVVQESVGTVTNAGAVNIIRGSASGLTSTGNVFLNQDTTNIIDICEENNFFGWALAAGNFNGDSYADLAIGVPGEDVDTIYAAGAVNVVYGSASGLTTANNQFWHQDITGMANTAEDEDYFGRALAAADFNGDGNDDLAVGIPYEDNGTVLDTGAVQVIYGSASGGLSVDDDWFIMQSSAGMLDTSEQWDHFGWALAPGDFDGDGYTDLAIGVPEEDVDTIYAAGAVSVVYGSASGLTTADNQFWHQDVTDIEDACEAGDRFGYALASGFRVQLPLFTDGFETGDTSLWSATTP